MGIVGSVGDGILRGGGGGGRYGRVEEGLKGSGCVGFVIGISMVFLGGEVGKASVEREVECLDFGLGSSASSIGDVIEGGTVGVGSLEVEMGK